MSHPALSIPTQAAAPDSRIGGLLLEAGKLNPEQAERVLDTQKEFGIRFGEAALRLGLINQADLRQVLARQFDYPYLEFGVARYSEQLVAAYQPFTPQVETLRAVRSQLMLRWFARGRKALVVQGVDGGDGASLFAANLAVVFSQLGQRTLLVDANLRQPRQHQIFALARSQGLSDMLAGRAGLDIIASVDAFAALAVLGAGTPPPNPQELLSRAAFASLNAQFKACHDVVLYDTPAFAAGADALAVIARAGGVLLVARANRTRLADIHALAAQVAHCGAEVVGSVLVEHG